MNRILVTTLSIAAVACARESTSPTQVTRPASVFGTYDLLSEGGASLPLRGAQGPTQRIDLLAENLVLSPDSSWRQNAVHETVFSTSSTRDSSVVALGSFYVQRDTLWFIIKYPGFGNPFLPYQASFYVIAGGDSLMMLPTPLWLWRRRS